jgi:hypothetical protein
MKGKGTIPIFSVKATAIAKLVDQIRLLEESFEKLKKG